MLNENYKARQVTSHFSRRRFLKVAGAVTGLAASGGLLVSCAGNTPTPAPATATPPKPTTAVPRPNSPVPGGGSAAAPGDKFSWSRSKGTSLNVLLVKSPWSDYLERLLPDFEALTGMKVHHESLAEQQANQNLISDFGGAGSYDVFNTSLYLEKQRFYQAGWYAPLNDFIKNPALTAPDYDYDKDLFAAAKEAGTMPDGKIVALPVYLDPLVLFYRKDILQEKGLKPPTTYEELETLAKTLHNPPNLYGLVGRGQTGANVVSWVAPLRAWGGDWLTKEGKANLNSPEAVQALEYYARLLRSYSPPEVANFNWNEASAAFAQGQAALYWDVINVAGQFEDPAKSKVAGKVGYAALPMGQSQGQPAVPYFASALAVSSKARNKEAAYLFCEWATSKEVMLKAQLTGLAGPRQSAGNLPGVKSRMPPDWGDAWLNSLKSASPGFPAISNVAGFRDIAGAAISDALGGKEVKAALDKANQEFQKLLDSL